VLGIVLLGAILPLALMGFWLTRTGVRSGEALLDNQLTTSLHSIEQLIAARWEYRRSDLLLLADNEAARHALSSGVVAASDSVYLAQVAATVTRGIAVFTYHDRAGRELYTSVRPASQSSPISPTSESPLGGVPRDTSVGPARRTWRVSLPVRVADTLAGSVVADVYVDAVIPADSTHLLLPGSALAVRDHASGAALLPLIGQVEFPPTPIITVGGARWMVRSDSLDDPLLDLAVAAPVGPYVTPFESAGRLGLVALGVVALLALVLSSFFTARLARSFHALADAAGAVAAGDLTRQVEPKGPAEFQGLAGSFNAMTDSVRRLVAELSQRRALAAVGEFAASLSHEVRNALTSVQIDLERVDERTEDAKNRALVERTLTHVRRLDAAVTGSLRIARSGTVAAEDVNLSAVVREAIRTAEPSFASSGARVTARGLEGAHTVRGDVEALQQLFLNLLLNAQQASPDGETIVTATRSDGRLIVSITDSGAGMDSEHVARAFDPYYTTRVKGTGLGLPIARQIAIAHGGDVIIHSTPGVGTTVEVSLPGEQ
jgi:signal transduction histidine kinase